MTDVQIPNHHDEITLEWLDDMFRSAGVDVAVESFTRREMGEGVGMMATIEMIDLVYADGTGPSTIVVKLKAVNEANRAVALAFDIYRREVLFYRDIADLTSAGTPTVFLAQADGPEDFVLVLEDLSGYRLGDQVDGCHRSDAETAMVTLAQLHAPFWDDVDRPEFDFIPYETPSTHGDALREGSLAGWEPMVAAFPDAVPGFMREIKERFLAAVPAMQRWLASSPSTIAHGDFRMDNLFYAKVPDQNAMMVIDWQGCLRSKGARDVAYLLSQSMPTEARRQHERNLVGLWHRTLVDEGVVGYSAEEAWEDYRRAVLALWILVVVIAGTLDSSNERGRVWMTEMIRRSAATIDDLDLLELLSEFE